MLRNRRAFQRPLGERRYKKLFVIAVEGSKTEPQYFAYVGNREDLVVKVLKGNKSAPLHVLHIMKRHLQQFHLLELDEAWIIVDKDAWTEVQLQQLFVWSKGSEKYGFALSNPHFEYWLLLHFEEGTGVTSGRDCVNRLKKYLPDYEKNLAMQKFTPEMIMSAMRRAKQRDNPRCVDWPRGFGTTVYRLVEKILM